MKNNNQYHRKSINHKRILWTVMCQQTGQPKRNGKFLETYILPRLNQEETIWKNKKKIKKKKKQFERTNH